MSFNEARQSELETLCRDIQRQEELAILFDIKRPVRPFMACPDNMGNDPCDDWDDISDDLDY